MRWMQYGVFQPIYRPHAQEAVPSEPVFRSDSAKALSKKAVELRYRLLPYNYHLVYQNHKTGAPLMRPLFFEEPNNEKLFNYDDAYLWGKDFLVAPIVKPEKQEKEVYFPKGSNWYDFYTDRKYNGGQTTTVAVNDTTIPTFVRGGAFIPMTETRQHAKAYSGRNLTLHYYADAAVEHSISKMYNDDGLTREAIEKGTYELLTFTANQDKDSLHIRLQAEMGKNYAISEKSIELVIHNVKDRPRQVRLNENIVSANWNKLRDRLHIPVEWNTKENVSITISWNE